MDHQHPLGSDEQPITRRCAARSKRSGERCRKSAMRGRSVCLAHGGRTPRGAASPHFKTGRYSRSLPGHLVATHEHALADPNLRSLRDEIALVEAMTCEELAQITDDLPWPNKSKLFERVCRLSDQRRKLAETEVRHIVLAHEMLTAEEALTLVHAVVAIVTRYLPHPKERQAIADEIYALISTIDAGARRGAHGHG